MRKLVVALCLLSTLFSCSDSDRDENDTTVSSYEYARAENAFFDVWKTIHAVIVTDTVLGGNDTTFANDRCIDAVTRTPNLGPYPIELTIKYLDGGELCSDGRTRGGTIKALISSPYSDSGSIVNVSFESFYIDDQYLSGTMDIVNVGNVGLLPVFTKSIKEAWLRRDALGNSRQEIYFNSEQQVIWGIGRDTYNNSLDDEFRATGSGSGRNTFGNFFEAKITDPLISRVSCVYESAGKVTLDQNTLATRFMDYGNGCDNAITVTFSGSTETLSIP